MHGVVLRSQGYFADSTNFGGGRSLADESPRTYNRRMKLLRRLLIAVLGLLPFAAPVLAQQPLDILDGKRLKELMLGNTLIGHTDWADAEWTSYIDLDGRMHIKGARPSGPYEFYGQATVEDDRWCEQWLIKNHNDKKCRQIAADGDRYDVLRDDGKVISSFTVRQGDPNGLSGPALAAALAAGLPSDAGNTAAPASDQPASGQPAFVETPPSQQPAAAALPPPAPVDTGTPAEVAATPPTSPAASPPAGAQPIELGLPQQQNSAFALTNESIIGWHRQGLDDAMIVALIKQSATKFDLSPAGLEKLDKAGITKTVIGAMLAADLSQ